MLTQTEEIVSGLGAKNISRTNKLCSQGKCYVWSLTGGFEDEPIVLQPKIQISAHKRYSLCCKFSPDSRYIISLYCFYCLPCKHRRKWTWVVKGVFGCVLRNALIREKLKLCALLDSFILHRITMAMLILLALIQSVYTLIFYQTPIFF